MNESISPIQQKYIDWYEAEQQKGLKEVRFSLAANSGATVDSVIQESFEIDQAIAAGHYSSIPESF